MKKFNKNYLFSLSFLVLTFIFIILARTSDEWSGLAYAILAFASFGASFIALIFTFLINRFSLKIQWYWYIIIIPLIFALGYGLLYLMVVLF